MPQLTTFRLYLLGIALLFAGYVTLEYNRPKSLNWARTFINKDKIPYGTCALYDQLPRLLGTDSIEAVRLPVYSQLTGRSVEQAANEVAEALPAPKTKTKTEGKKHGFGNVATPLRPERSNYLFLNESFAVSDLDAHTLLKYVAQGNDVFVAAQSFANTPKLLRDSLGFGTEEVELVTHQRPKGLPVVDSVDLRFSNPGLAAAHIRLPGAGV